MSSKRLIEIVRNEIADFVAYAWDNSWVVQETIDAIRNGSYRETMKTAREIERASRAADTAAVEDGEK